jgi:hypothetical protein
MVVEGELNNDKLMRWRRKNPKSDLCVPMTCPKGQVILLDHVVGNETDVDCISDDPVLILVCIRGY